MAVSSAPQDGGREVQGAVLLSSPSLLARTGSYLPGGTQEIDSRMGSRMSKLKEVSEDVQSSNSQFIFNLKTLSSKGKFMQSPSLYIDKRRAVLTVVGWTGSHPACVSPFQLSLWNPHRCKEQSLMPTNYPSTIHPSDGEP